MKGEGVTSGMINDGWNRLGVCMKTPICIPAQAFAIYTSYTLSLLRSTSVVVICMRYPNIRMINRPSWYTLSESKNVGKGLESGVLEVCTELYENRRQKYGILILGLESAIIAILRTRKRRGGLIDGLGG